MAHACKSVFAALFQNQAVMHITLQARPNFFHELPCFCVMGCWQRHCIHNCAQRRACLAHRHTPHLALCCASALSSVMLAMRLLTSHLISPTAQSFHASHGRVMATTEDVAATFAKQGGYMGTWEKPITQMSCDRFVKPSNGAKMCNDRRMDSQHTCGCRTRWMQALRCW